MIGTTNRLIHIRALLLAEQAVALEEKHFARCQALRASIHELSKAILESQGDIGRMEHPQQDQSS